MSCGGGCKCCPKCGCQKTCTCNHSMPGLDETMGDFSYTDIKPVAGANSYTDMKSGTCANEGSSISFHSETTTEKRKWDANFGCPDGTSWGKGEGSISFA